MEEDEYNDIVTCMHIFSGWKVIMSNAIQGYILIINFFHLSGKYIIVLEEI
jgi:hypothetical protein